MNLPGTWVRSVHGRSAARGARRPLRPAGQGPADLDHRPLQFPLHVLHAGGGHDLARPAPSCSPTRSWPGSPGSAWSGSASRRSGSPAASRRVRAQLPRLFELLAPLGVDLAMTTNGVRLPELAARPRRGRARRVNVSLDSLRRETFLALTRRDELDRVLAGIDAALDAGLAPGEGQRGRDPGRQRRRGRRPRGVRPREGRRRALHRVHAARRAGRVDDGPGRSRERDPRPDRRGVPARVHCRGRGPPRRRAGGPFPLPRRRRRRRRDPERDRALLRQLRPGADHRRGQVPHLPVRARRVRPAGHPARRRVRRRSRGRDRTRRRARSGPGTTSARSTSCVPAAR